MNLRTPEWVQTPQQNRAYLAGFEHALSVMSEDPGLRVLLWRLLEQDKAELGMEASA